MTEINAINSLRPLTVVPGTNIMAVQWTARNHWTAVILGPGTTVYGLKLCDKQIYSFRCGNDGFNQD